MKANKNIIVLLIIAVIILILTSTNPFGITGFGGSGNFKLLYPDAGVTNTKTTIYYWGSNPLKVSAMGSEPSTIMVYANDDIIPACSWNILSTNQDNTFASCDIIFTKEGTNRIKVGSFRGYNNYLFCAWQSGQDTYLKSKTGSLTQQDLYNSMNNINKCSLDETNIRYDLQNSPSIYQQVNNDAMSSEEVIIDLPVVSQAKFQTIIVEKPVYINNNLNTGTYKDANENMIMKFFNDIYNYIKNLIGG